MEKLQNLRHCPWISPELDVEEYFSEYHRVLDEVCGNGRHNDEINSDEAIKNFFISSGGDEDMLMDTVTPTSAITPNRDINSEDVVATDPKDPTSAATNSRPNSTILQDKETPFTLERMHQDCSIDLLTVDDEVQQEKPKKGPSRMAGRIANWYVGTFMDGVIPDGAADKLSTLKAQSEELHKRVTIKNYGCLRNRLFKYAKTFRVVADEDNQIEPIKKEFETKRSLREVAFNIRVQRPFHKKVHQRKACNKFPSHSQELLMLGSQKLTELRDAINCINDLAVNEDMSRFPELYRLNFLPNGSVLFPSGFIYINGTFYVDRRKQDAVDESENIRKWAKRFPDIGEMHVATMGDVRFKDLKIRLGYPCVYIHQGNCEHLITFTDVRLHHKDDIQDVQRYPVLRGQATKFAMKCYSCSLRLANWIVKGDSRIPVPNAHLCDICLKIFCYGNTGKKIMNIRVYPFFDEFKTQQKKHFTELSSDTKQT